MTSRIARRAVTTIVLLAALASPATAAAWTVTVHIHGAGKVDDIDRGAGFDCTVSMTAKSESSLTNCVFGSADGVYNSSNIVELAASVPSGHFDRGWRFSRWVDTPGGGGGKIDCDDTGGAGQPPVTNCKFQVWENLEVDLYFDDIEGPQDTSISSGPSGPIRATTAAFNFTSGDPDAGYECRLEKPNGTVDWYACGTTSDKGESYSSLTAQGEYTFRVRGKDPTGNVDFSPATRTFTVDTVAPTVTLSGTPANGAHTTSRNAGFTATASEAGSVACALDGSPLPCSAPIGNLADGSHTFAAQATDTAGNVGPTATRTWTVDTTGPVITLGDGPPAASNQTTAAFTWTANEGGTFACSLDGGAFAPCVSGVSYPDLGDGPHTFRVRGTDTLGNEGAAVERAWTVDTAVPDTTLLSGPAEGSTSAQSSATFTFASPESGTTFECRLDGATFAPCTSPATLHGLTNDDHVFEVRALDAAGNVDQTPARRAWRVNALDADADGVNRPADCRDDDAAIRPGATDTPGDGIDQDCSGADAAVAVDPDRDDDGVNVPLDCNDGSAAIRPGATDVPRDGIDQDCSGADAEFPFVGATLSYKFAVNGSTTRVARLLLTRLARGTKVKVVCKGKRCPMRSKTVKPRKGRVDVRRSVLRRRALRAGQTLTITISRPGHIAKVIRFKMRRRKAPTGGTVRCLAPGARRTTACAG